MTRVLVVCTANICRSPMAEVLLDRAASQRDGAEVASAGVWATPGLPASEGSVLAMSRLGLDLSQHRSRRVSPQLVDHSDLIVTMESQHVVELVSRHPDAAGRTFTLRELVALADTDGSAPGGDLAQRLGSLAARRSVRDHLGRTDLDVADPIGGSRSRYRRCADELEQLCDELAGWLWGRLS